MFKTVVIFIIILTLSATSASTMTSDREKERRWAAQIVDALIDGDAHWLKTEGHDFLAIYTQTNNKDNHHAVIILHGMGAHPDWPQVVNPLRTGLAERGWSTLSLQMPVLPNEATVSDYIPLFEDVAPRIEAGVKFLQAQGIQQIVLIGHSLGADMACYYLAKHHDLVTAFVGVGMTANPSKKQVDPAVSLVHIKLPVLDLYGSNDLRGVLNSTDTRAAAAAKAGNKRFTQIKVQGADHFFDDNEDKLVETVHTWLTAQK